MKRDKAWLDEFNKIFTQTDWDRCLEYFGKKCAACRRRPSLNNLLTRDHWQPLGRGGAVGAENVVPLCEDCNGKKGPTPPDIWIAFNFPEEQGAAILRRVEAFFNWRKAMVDREQTG